MFGLYSNSGLCLTPVSVVHVPAKNCLGAELPDGASHLMKGPAHALTGFILHTTTWSSVKSLCAMSSATTGTW